MTARLGETLRLVLPNLPYLRLAHSRRAIHFNRTRIGLSYVTNTIRMEQNATRYGTDCQADIPHRLAFLEIPQRGGG